MEYTSKKRTPGKPQLPQNIIWTDFHEERVRRKWGQKEAAAFFGVTQATISSWEGGMTAPSFAAWPRIAEFLQLTVPEIGAQIGKVFFSVLDYTVVYNPKISKNK